MLNFNRCFLRRSILEYVLKELRLNSLSERYTCEIFQASLIFIGDDICWCDSEDWEDADSLDYDGIAVRASSMCWRVVEDALGSDEFYKSKDMMRS